MTSDTTTKPAPVALVTAAGRGMGAAIARELAARGWRLALLSPSGGAEALAAELGGVGMRGSVTEPADLERLVGLALDRYGRIDGAVSNTGHAPKGPLLDISDGQWHEALDLLVLNVVRLARLVVPVMERQGGGAFVNISTFAAFEPDPAFPLSSSLRAALGSFTKLFADRYAAQGIRMNNVLPGFVDSWPGSPENIRRIPAGRYARTDEIAKAVAFLLSGDASYVTGQNLRVDGGLTRAV